MSSMKRLQGNITMNPVNQGYIPIGYLWNLRNNRTARLAGAKTEPVVVPCSTLQLHDMFARKLQLHWAHRSDANVAAPVHLVHRQSPFSSTIYMVHVQNLLEEPMHCRMAGDLARQSSTNQQEKWCWSEKCCKRPFKVAFLKNNDAPMDLGVCYF